MIRLKYLIVSILIPLGIGGLAALLTMNSREVYESLEKPPLSPPSYIFGIVWTILFILMGISAYMIYESDNPLKKKALTVYGVQLIMNFIWPLLFFGAQAYVLSAVWIVALWLVIIYMIILFYKIKPAAAFLQIPYLLWVTFAGWLNIWIAILNN